MILGNMRLLVPFNKTCWLETSLKTSTGAPPQSFINFISYKQTYLTCLFPYLSGVRSDSSFLYSLWLYSNVISLRDRRSLIRYLFLTYTSGCPMFSLFSISQCLGQIFLTRRVNKLFHANHTCHPSFWGNYPNDSS